jgi:hypothetical protein
MTRRFAAPIALFVLAIPALAGNAGAGEYNFTMPSSNVECIYSPAGGTDAYETADGRAELSCDRVRPSYLRVALSSSGAPKNYTHVGDASCCSVN